MREERHALSAVGSRQSVAFWNLADWDYICVGSSFPVFVSGSAASNEFNSGRSVAIAHSRATASRQVVHEMTPKSCK